MTATAASANQNQSAHAFVDKAADKIHDLIDNAGSEVEDTKEAITQRLQINPLASLIVALGAGFVLDRLVRPARAETSNAHASSHLPELLLGLGAVGQTAVTQFLYRRLMADTAKIAALTVFGALIAGVGVIGGFYALYLVLLGYGMSAAGAAAAVGGGAVAVAAMVIALAGRAIRRMHQTAMWLPLASDARKIAKRMLREVKKIVD